MRFLGFLLSRFWSSPFFDQERFAAYLEAYFDEHGLFDFEREHAVFCQVFGDVYQEFTVFSSEQAPSSFTNQNFPSY
jgi:hypothetical protein